MPDTSLTSWIYDDDDNGNRIGRQASEDSSVRFFSNQGGLDMVYMGNWSLLFMGWDWKHGVFGTRYPPLVFRLLFETDSLHSLELKSIVSN